MLSHRVLFFGAMKKKRHTHTQSHRMADIKLREVTSPIPLSILVIDFRVINESCHQQEATKRQSDI